MILGGVQGGGAAVCAPWLAAALYVGCTVAVAYCVVTLVTWIFLTRGVRLG